MSEVHLLLIALGPVQDFIAQARRSRDLWFGSHLLSELSRAAARSMAQQDATLIFPALDQGDPELGPCDGSIRQSTLAPPVSVANKILARLPAGCDPADCARTVRNAVSERWNAIAARARHDHRVAAVLASDIDGIWSEQVDDVLEFYGAWTPLGNDFAKARAAAEQALAGRKVLREFRPWQHHRDGAPKSSLDGARASVLRKQRNGSSFRDLRITTGEQLDAIGLIKRAGFRPDQFLPVLNVAAAEWLLRAEATAPQQLQALRAACKAKQISGVQWRLAAAIAFPFDASVLYPSRWHSVFRELEPARNSQQAQAWGEEHVKPLLKAMHGAPPFYVACLAADGDHMGRAIDSLGKGVDITTTITKCREFSRKLAAFPIKARCLIEEECHGSLIYAGGDDVLAFLPVATAVECASALATHFQNLLRPMVPEGNAPTLSVGLAIAHGLDAMGELVGLAREAERTAKQAGRNRLAIIFDKRSGGRRTLVLPWSANPLCRMRDSATLLKTKISGGKVYELEALRRRFPHPERDGVPAVAAEALAAYANDLLAHGGENRSADANARVTLAELGVEETGEYRALHAAIGEAVERLLIARALGEGRFE